MVAVSLLYLLPVALPAVVDTRLTPGSDAGGGTDGQCCTLCKMGAGTGNCAAAGGCALCWKRSSFCSWGQTRCTTQCKATWCTGPSAELPQPGTQMPLLDSPRPALWNLSAAQAGVTVDGTDAYIVSGAPVSPYLVNATNYSVPVSKVSTVTGEVLWNTTVLVGDAYLAKVDPPAITNSSVLLLTERVPEGPRITALSTDSGRERWHVNLTERLIPTAVSAGEGYVYYLDANGDLVARSAVNGSRVWAKPVGSCSGGVGWAWSGPLLAGGRVFKGGRRSDNPTVGNYMFAFEPETGDEEWALHVPTAAWQPSVAFSESPSVILLATTFFYHDLYGISLPLGEPDGRLQAFDAASSQLPQKTLWSMDLPAAIGTPVMANDPTRGTLVAYFTACSTPPSQWFFWLPPLSSLWTGCDIWAVDVRAAADDPFDAVLWRRRVTSNLALASLTVAGGAVFVSGSVFNTTLPPFFNCTAPNSSSGGPASCDYPDWWPAQCRIYNFTPPVAVPTACPWVKCNGTLAHGIPNCTILELPNISLPSGPLPGYTDPFVMALQAENGRVLWRHGVGSQDVLPPYDMTAFSVNGDGTVLVYGSDATAVAIDVSARESGGARTRSWVIAVAAALAASAVLSAGGVVLVKSGWLRGNAEEQLRLLTPPDDSSSTTSRYVPDRARGTAHSNAWSSDPKTVVSPSDGVVSAVSCLPSEAASRPEPGPVLVSLGSQMPAAERPESQPKWAMPAEPDVLQRVRVQQQAGTTPPGQSTSASTASQHPLPLQEAELLYKHRQYEVLKEVGRGGFGKVLLAKRRGEMLAMKRVCCRTDRELRVALQEVRLLRYIPPHPGLIRIRDAFSSRGCVYFTMPYHAHGDLADFVETFPSDVIDEPTVICCVTQVASVLRHLHSLRPQVVHRDLKPANILVDRQPLSVRFTVTDFGLARLVDKTYLHTHAGTMAFMAPEAFDGPYDAKVDIWSLGCVVYSIALKRTRECKVMCVHVARKGFHQEITAEVRERGYGFLVVDLVRQMLQFDPRARPAADELLFRMSPASPPSLRLGEVASPVSSPVPPTPVPRPPDASDPALTSGSVPVGVLRGLIGRRVAPVCDGADSSSETSAPSTPAAAALPLGLLRGIALRAPASTALPCSPLSSSSSSDSC
eukprot:TRINITY_DN1551_c2_g2_i1.p1 TRINITY_DN1551_c2_g2~~TRINITY_DN1551_c2_g2_i1.p1  ORF type:complete len:1184 (+),score=319.96 TRINITY_DN1551_c2_g2_i1:116-3553(+)